jgi:hypothetical protein
MVDPDRWLIQVDKQAFARTIRANGTLTINRQDYYMSRSLAGQRVTCWVNAAERRFEIWQPAGYSKSIPIKGRQGKIMPFQEYVALMRARGALGIPALSAYPSQAHPGSSVGVSLPPVEVGRAMLPPSRLARLW